MAALPVVDALSELINLLVMLLEKCAGNARLHAAGYNALFPVSYRRHKVSFVSIFVSLYIIA